MNQLNVKAASVLVRRGAALVASFIVLSWTISTGAAALPEGSPRDAGAVAMVDGSGQELDGAGSATVFSMHLPANATCPGDSMHDSWRVQSFLVPSTVDVGKLEYNVIGPVGDAQFALYTTTDNPYTDQNLLPNAEAGAPAVIGNLPAFHFTRFPVGILPAGTYKAGIACTLFGETATYWDTELIVTTSPDDKPAQFVWRVVGTPPDLDSSSHERSSSWSLAVLLGVVAAVATGFVFWNRGRAATTTSSQREPS